MKVVLGSVVASALLIAGPAFAAGPAPAEAAACMACHNADNKIVGPAYKDVAKKYAADKNAVDALTKKVIEGGKGNWGEIPMPPRGGTALKDDEIKKVVAWVMTLK